MPQNILKTSKGENLTILDKGRYNLLSGPDFFNARLILGHQQWAGNVEIHVRASDWYVHGHEKDMKYNNVILHVVWENDIDVFREDNTIIPTLVLKEYISKNLLNAYKTLFNKEEKTFINCEKQIGGQPALFMENWMDRLFLERLEKKTLYIEKLLSYYENDWEHVLFILLLKNFGSKINGDSFYEIGKGLKYSLVRKLKQNTHQLESVLFGMAGFLSDVAITDQYYRTLQKEFHFLQSKWDLKPHIGIYPEFFKLRPANFPTIRLSQFAGLYQKHPSLFGKLMEAATIEELYNILEITSSAYWIDHFTFGKISKPSVKKLSKKFMDLLLINTIIPLKFCYARYRGEDKSDFLMEIVSQIKKENNSIVVNFENLKVPVVNALQSQAILELYTTYCSKNKCLQCAVGMHLLNREQRE